MKRILLVLTVLALGGGCHDTCDTPGSITYYWRFVGSTGRVVGTFDVDDASTPVPSSACYVDGIPFIDTIRITVAGTVEEVPCAGPNRVPGAVLPGFLGGSHDWRVDGLRGSGAGATVLFSETGTTPVAVCANTNQFVDLQAVSPSELVVYYDVNNQPPASCQVGGVPITNVVYELRNASNQIVDSSCVSRSPPVTGVCQLERTTACDPVSLGFTTIPVPLGNYTMNYLELWQGNAQPMVQICAGQPGSAFVHDGFPVFLNLTASGGQFCPANSPASPLLASAPAAP